MLLEAPGRPLREAEVPRPEPGPGQVLLRIQACGVCRTDLHVRDGELPDPKRPLILGHEIVGTVMESRPGGRWRAGDRIGVPWLGWTCGVCGYCRSGRENLCPAARFTGYQIDGGYAEYAVADERFCFRLAGGRPDAETAPLLCAGLIGYRALRAAGEAARLGLYGFGAAAHLVTQVARAEGRQIFAFTKPGDRDGQAFARELGAVWAGGSDERPPDLLDAAILFAPVGALVPIALAATVSGGTVVCAGIHMSDLPRFPYALLWGERTLRSVANLTRRDGEEFLTLAAGLPLRVAVQPYPLNRAEEALGALRQGRVQGAAVLLPQGPEAQGSE
ncbi:MAG TPA: zinc-dependent alcohol dehydrogenase family protein [Candidatus Sulfotelmatobacter sp.]|nr:zinc-dependent alcohol dehydrogenase family protein [Candidatus Sulfotelmatobacter sp.]